MDCNRREQNGQTIHGRSRIFICLTSLFACFFVSGCEIEDLIKEIIGRPWGQETIGVMIYPPFPRSFFNNKNQSMINHDFVFSENVRSALESGVSQFNSTKPAKKVIPWYMSEKGVRNFYNGLELGGNARPYLNEEIIFLRDDPNEKLARDITVLIFGEFNDADEYATSYRCTFYYFDYRTNFFTSEKAAVTKDSGRAQNGELENLMTALLKKALNK